MGEVFAATSGISTGPGHGQAIVWPWLGPAMAQPWLSHGPAMAQPWPGHVLSVKREFEGALGARS